MASDGKRGVANGKIIQTGNTDNCHPLEAGKQLEDSIPVFTSVFRPRRLQPSLRVHLSLNCAVFNLLSVIV